MHTTQKRILGLVAVSLAAACGQPTTTAVDKSAPPQTYTGRASAAPIAAGTVTAHALDANGNAGPELGSCPTDANGNFSLNILPTFPLQLSVSGGTYREEADGNTVAVNIPLRLLLADSNTTAVGITPLTEIAASRALANNANGLATAIEDAAYAVAQAAGLPSILVPPADPNAPGADPNAPGTKYALFLASLSQLAANSNQSSLVVTLAFSQDFRHDGQFNGSDNGNAVVLDANAWGDPNRAVGSQPPFALSPNAWGAGIPDATTTYLNNPNANGGRFSVESQTVVTAAPPLVAPRDPNGSGPKPTDPNTAGPKPTDPNGSGPKPTDPNMQNPNSGGPKPTDPNTPPPPPPPSDPNNGGPKPGDPNGPTGNPNGPTGNPNGPGTPADPNGGGSVPPKGGSDPNNTGNPNNPNAPQNPKP